MNKKILIIIISLFSINSYAQAQLQLVVNNTNLNAANEPFIKNNVLNTMLNATTNAAEKAGKSVNSAVSTLARSNLVKSALLGGTTAGIVGAVAGVAIGGILDWSNGSITSNPNGTITLKNNGGLSSSLAALSSGSIAWKSSSNVYQHVGYYSSDPSAFLSYVALGYNRNVDPSNTAYYVSSIAGCSINVDTYSCTQLQYADGHISNTNILVASQDYVPNSCPIGNISTGSSCIPDPNASSSEQTQIIQMNELLSHLTANDLNQKLTSEQLSTLTNALITSLNQSGYQNAPLTTPSDFVNTNITLGDVIQPITPEIVADYQPLSRNVVTPSNTTTTTTTTTNTDGSTTNNTTINNNLDLGADPGIQAPILEVPTSESILDPIFNIMDRNFTVQISQGTCPTFTFTVLGNTFNYSQVCSLLESNSYIIQSVMLLSFTITSIIIVLSS